MAEAANLQIVISAQDLASAKLKEVQAQSESMGQGFENTGKSIKSAGSAFLPFSAAAAVGLGLAVKTATDFNQQMLLIQTQAGGSAKEVASLTTAVLKLAPAVGQSPQELAKALFFVESAGFRGTQAMDILKLSAEGAAVGQADLSETTKVLTSLLHDNMIGAENSTIAMGNLNAIVGAGKMTFSDLNAAMSTGVADIAAAAGVSLPSLGAALATLTNKGIPAVDAATHLKMMIMQLEVPTAKSAATLESMGMTIDKTTGASTAMSKIIGASGVSFSKLAEDLKKPNGISVAIQDLQDHLIKAGFSSADAANIIEKSLGGIKSGSTAVELSRSLGDVNNAFKQITKSGGDFSNSWAAQQQTAKQHMEDFKASVSVLMVQLGNAFLPILDKIIKVVGEVADRFSRLSPGVREIIVVALALTAVLGPLLIMIGSMVTAIGVLASPITLIVIGVALLAAGVLYLHSKWKEIKDYLNDHVMPVFRDIGKWFTDIYGYIEGFFKQALSDVVQWFKDVVKQGDKVLDFLEKHKKAIEHVVDVLLGIFGPALLKIAAQAVATAAVHVASAVAAGAAWAGNAAIAAVSWTTHFIIMTAKAIAMTAVHVVQASIAGAIWAAKAAVATAAWTIQFAIMSARAVASAVIQTAQAAIAGYAWVINATRSSAAWLITFAIMVAKAIWATGIMVTQAIIAGTAWSSAAGVARGAVTSLFAYIGAGAVMGSIAVAGALADIALVAKAVQTVIQTIGVMNQMKAGIAADQASMNSMIPQMKATAVLSNNPQARTSARNTLHMLGVPGYAAGVTNFEGGLALVGEAGPELVNLPRGTNIIPNNRVAAVTNNSSSKTVTIGTVNLGDASAVSEFFKQLDRDNILVSKGLTPARGV